MLNTGTACSPPEAALGEVFPLPGTRAVPGVGTRSQGSRVSQNSTMAAAGAEALLVFGGPAVLGAAVALEECSLPAPAGHRAVLKMLFHSFTRCFFLFLFLGAVPGAVPSPCSGFSAAAGRELRTRANSLSHAPEVPLPTRLQLLPSTHTRYSQSPPSPLLLLAPGMQYSPPQLPLQPYTRPWAPQSSWRQAKPRPRPCSHLGAAAPSPYRSRTATKKPWVSVSAGEARRQHSAPGKAASPRQGQEGKAFTSL